MPVDFARVQGRAVVPSFDGGRITFDTGAPLLGSTDRVIGLTTCLAACFTDARNAAFVEHEVQTLVMQRVAGIALGYKHLGDNDELRHDLVMAVLGATSPPGGRTARRCRGWASSTPSARATAANAPPDAPGGRLRTTPAVENSGVMSPAVPGTR